MADEDRLVLLRFDAQLLHLVHQRAQRTLAAARLAHGGKLSLAVCVHDRLDAEHRTRQCSRGADASAVL